jgi:hypothetical protein
MYTLLPSWQYNIGHAVQEEAIQALLSALDGTVASAAADLYTGNRHTVPASTTTPARGKRINGESAEDLLRRVSTRIRVGLFTQGVDASGKNAAAHSGAGAAHSAAGMPLPKADVWDESIDPDMRHMQHLQGDAARACVVRRVAALTGRNSGTRVGIVMQRGSPKVGSRQRSVLQVPPHEWERMKVRSRVHPMT